MLGNLGTEQAGYLTELETAAAAEGLSLHDMLSTAAGQRPASTMAALRAVGEHACQAPAEAHYNDAADSEDDSPEAVCAEEADEETAAEVDLCRFGLEMSRAEVFNGFNLIGNCFCWPC